MLHLTFGLLAFDGPQNRAIAVPLHLGTLKQSLVGFPHLELMFLYWQLVLQQVDPAKLPFPGSHCSPTSTRALPQTGGIVIEAVGENEGVTDVVAVLVPVWVMVTDPVVVQVPVAVLVQVPVLVTLTELLLEFVTELVNEFELELVNVLETVLVPVGSGVSVGDADSELLLVLLVDA